MKTEEIKKQLKKMMIASTEPIQEKTVRSLLLQLPKEALCEVSSLVKNCLEFAERERCRYFTMIKGAKHRHNCQIVAKALQTLAA